MLPLSSPTRFALPGQMRHSSRLITRTGRHRLYATDATPTIKSAKPRKGLIRSVIIPTTFFGGIFYGAAIYGSFHNDKFHDFFVENVPLGETLISYCEESNLEQLGDISKRAIEMTTGVIRTVREGVGAKARAEPNPVEAERRPSDSPLEKMKAKTEAAVKRGQESLAQTHSQTAGPMPTKKEPAAPIANPQPVDVTTQQSTPLTSPSPEPLPSSPSRLPLYGGTIPIGHEPPPGYLGSAPRPRDPSTGPAPEPPKLPLLAPTVKQLSSSEPILSQLASTIDSLAGFLRDNPDVVIRGKDGSGQDAPKVLMSAEADLKKLAERLEAIKAEERARLENQLEKQAKEYSKMLLQAEKELHERLDQQEENWKDTFDIERARLARGFEAKMTRELESQEELIDERLRQEVISTGLQMQRRWMRKIKSQVELEREGRLGKLNELESCIKELGRATLDHDEYLDDNLRVNRLWNALRAISAAAFDRPIKAALADEVRGLERICNRNSKMSKQEGQEEANHPTIDVLSTALESIPPVVVESGVNCLPSLTVWFRESVAPRIRSASLFPEHGGLVSYMASNLLSKFLFTHSQNPSGHDPISILSRVEGYLDSQDLEQATRELNSLSGWPKVLARDWIEAARSHLELQQALQIVETEARLQSLLL